MNRFLICTILLSTCLFFNSLLYGAADVPLPAGAVKTLEKNADIGPSHTVVRSYETSLSASRLSAFYKREMSRLGWREQKDGFFLKDGDLAIIAVNPRRNKNNKTLFTVTTSRVPDKEEILALRKDKPDKLNFMPVYPGSKQVFLWDTPTGISASYDTADSIKEVTFFYKSGMLNYGWRLYEETPVTTEALGCPECEKAAAKLSKDTAKPQIKGTSSRASLIFRRGVGESCIIRIYQGSAAIQALTGTESKAADTEKLSAPFNKTTILVTYNADKKINP